jgi:hypothetical protein
MIHTLNSQETALNKDQPAASRRGFFMGAVAAGAAAAAVTSLPNNPLAEAVSAPQAKPEKGGGYSLSEHVKRYYQTTRV